MSKSVSWSIIIVCLAVIVNTGAILLNTYRIKSVNRELKEMKCLMTYPRAKEVKND